MWFDPSGIPGRTFYSLCAGANHTAGGISDKGPLTYHLSPGDFPYHDQDGQWSARSQSGPAASEHRPLTSPYRSVNCSAADLHQECNIGWTCK